MNIRLVCLYCFAAFFATARPSDQGLSASLSLDSSRDSDGDGLEDVLESQLDQSGPQGLGSGRPFDYDEHCKYRTDPLKADSDGDGTLTQTGTNAGIAYTIRAVCEIRPPNDLALMTDLYQDARPCKQRGRHKDSTVVELLLFPMATPHVMPQPYPASSTPDCVLTCT
jgi:hypothetical protein